MPPNLVFFDRVVLAVRGPAALSAIGLRRRLIAAGFDPGRTVAETPKMA
jgi:hypothetical protein